MNYSDIKNILTAIDDDALKLEVVMDLGKGLAAVPDNAICSEIVGCSSFVEICRAGNRFYGRADSAIVRGIVAIFIAMLDSKTSDEIKKIDIESEFNSLNLNLGAGRLNGVNSMIRFFRNL
jgi:sulfur transfer protein SufE